MPRVVPILRIRLIRPALAVHRLHQVQDQILRQAPALILVPRQLLILLS